MENYFTELQQESLRWAKEEMLPPENVLKSLILETKDKILKTKCKLICYGMRKNAGLKSLMDKHELVHWKKIEEIHIERLQMFLEMKALQNSILRFPININDLTIQERLLFAELGNQFLEKGKLAFKSKLIRVRSKANKVVIERNPDQDFWLSGAPLDHLDHYIMRTESKAWVSRLQFKPIKDEILAKKEVLVTLKTEKALGKRCATSSRPTTPTITRKNHHKRTRSKIVALKIFRTA